MSLCQLLIWAVKQNWVSQSFHVTNPSTTEQPHKDRHGYTTSDQTPALLLSLSAASSYFKYKQQFIFPGKDLNNWSLPLFPQCTATGPGWVGRRRRRRRRRVLLMILIFLSCPAWRFLAPTPTHCFFSFGPPNDLSMPGLFAFVPTGTLQPLLICEVITSETTWSVVRKRTKLCRKGGPNRKNPWNRRTFNESSLISVCAI